MMTLEEWKRLSRKNRDNSLWHSLRDASAYEKCGDCDGDGICNSLKCYDDYCRAYNSDLSPFPEVAVPEKDACLSLEYGNNVDVSLQQRRFNGNALSDDTVRKNHADGKTGEFIVMRTLERLGIRTDAPDVAIYANSSKSFGSDLHAVMNGVVWKMSIKTCCVNPSVSRVSWVAQLKDGDGRARGCDMHFFSEDDSHRKNLIFAGVLLSPDKRHGRILSFMPMQVLYDADVYEEMEIDGFHGYKKAIYWDRLVEKGIAGRLI